MWSWTSVGRARPVEAAQQAALLVVADRPARSARGRPSSRLRIVSGLSSSRWISSRAVAGRRRPRAWAGRTRRGRCGPVLAHCGGPESAPHDLLVGHVDQQRRGERAADASRAPRRAPRPGRPCAGTRRAGSRRARRPRSRRSTIIADDHVVGHEVAGVHVAASASRPSSVPCATAPRRMSPVAMYGRPKSSRRRSACVPLPAPGGPSRIRFSSRHGASTAEPCATALLQEALVVAHHQLRLELLHRVERDADDDQQRGAAEEEVGAASG